jgi:hypothetical protein
MHIPAGRCTAAPPHLCIALSDMEGRSWRTSPYGLEVVDLVNQEKSELDLADGDQQTHQQHWQRYALISLCYTRN